MEEEAAKPDDTRKPCAVTGLEVRAADDQTLVYDQQAAKVHVLNRTAAHVLALCDGSRTVEDIAAALAAAFATDTERARTDVEAILRTFASLRLLAE